MTRSPKSLAFALLFLAALSALGIAKPQAPSKVPPELDSILSKLDKSAIDFKSAQADIVWDKVQTQPIEDTDSQVGTAIFERGKSTNSKPGEMRMALHIRTDNGKPALKDMVYSKGVGYMYQPSIKQEQVFKIGDNKAALDAFLTLGFGGSGEDLKKTWKIALLGTETVNGSPAAKLQLLPIDPKLAESTTKVFLWIDLKLGVAVKQQRFSPDASYLMLTYSNIRLNGTVPSGAFEIKTAPGTQIQNHQ